MKLRGIALLLAALLLLPAAAEAQKKKKGKDKNQDTVATSAVLPDEHVIEAQITEMLAAWQIGDVERMRQHHAEDVTVVSGAYAPPLVGWGNYVKAYQRQHARSQGVVQLNRRNTLIRTNGNTAWASYQWEFLGVVDGSQLRAQGHTTLVLEKRDGRWLIVHNHTSLAAPEPSDTTEASAKPGP